ncbi:carbohydrate esterase family 1 protein [Dothidotthia symphoricarpi CBS 119687]|uniref:feruloyl esterase n=1 Tax=Dothidotthia symphoricarpi CBS 119687 TaxID=1392245 RepID=A0A6A6ABV1_9PLEO|nr:carbohydrate esterase family 1 protein [Dothidotthia symphoricarpi CBS 119687]KAF2128337.1 carbohydrate esterase family 1 protein [Dothidotthia symphoricarpi CBS 119687]
MSSGTRAQAPTTSASSCGKALPEGVQLGHSVNLTISSDSVNQTSTTRRYRIHVPRSYPNNAQVPVIFSFHGRSRDALFQEELSQFSNASYGFKGISVYPEGWPTSNTGIQQWQGDPDAPSYVNDTLFTLEILNHLEHAYCVDPTRVYAAGKSNGGGFTGLLACDPIVGAKFAAFAVVSGAFYLNEAQQLPSCNNLRQSTPITEFHGFEDTTILYAGGLNTRKTRNTTSIVAYVDDWAERNSFQISANTSSHLCSGGKKVTRYSWGNDQVVHYNYTNLGHDWPSSFSNRDTESDLTKLTCKEAEATSIILKWFKKWTL